MKKLIAFLLSICLLISLTIAQGDDIKLNESKEAFATSTDQILGQFSDSTILSKPKYRACLTVMLSGDLFNTLDTEEKTIAFLPAFSSSWCGYCKSNKTFYVVGGNGQGNFAKDEMYRVIILMQYNVKSGKFKYSITKLDKSYTEEEFAKLAEKVFQDNSVDEFYQNNPSELKSFAAMIGWSQE